MNVHAIAKDVKQEIVLIALAKIVLVTIVIVKFECLLERSRKVLNSSRLRSNGHFKFKRKFYDYTTSLENLF